MKKMIYEAICEENNGGDSWDLIATFNKAEAIKAAKGDIAHMMPAELKRRTVSVQGYELYVEYGMSTL